MSSLNDCFVSTIKNILIYCQSYIIYYLFSWPGWILFFYYKTAQIFSSTFWKIEYVKPNSKTLLRCAADLAKVAEESGGSGGSGGGGGGALSGVVERALEMAHVVDSCRRGAFEHAKEYSEGKKYLMDMYLQMRKDYRRQKLVEKFGMEIPEELLRKEEEEEGMEGEEKKREDDEKKYHVIQLEEEKVWYVDDIASLMEAQQRLEMEGELSIVGLDLEWRDPRPAALLQLGFRFHRVLLIDILPCLNDLEAAKAMATTTTTRATTTTTSAQPTSYTHQLTQFLNNLLTNSIVVGYGFLNDIQRLGRALPLLRPSSFQMNVVDLSLVNTKTSSLLEMLCPAAYQEYQAGPPPKKGSGRGGGGAGGRRRQNKSKGKGKGKGKGKKHVAWCTMGLSGLVEKSFGKPLSKAEQCSNWDRRPLTKSQRKYAAMDALILVELYEVGAERKRKELI